MRRVVRSMQLQCTRDRGAKELVVLRKGFLKASQRNACGRMMRVLARLMASQASVAIRNLQANTHDARMAKLEAKHAVHIENEILEARLRRHKLAVRACRLIALDSDFRTIQFTWAAIRYRWVTELRETHATKVGMMAEEHSSELSAKENKMKKLMNRHDAAVAAHEESIKTLKDKLRGVKNKGRDAVAKTKQMGIEAKIQAMEKAKTVHEERVKRLSATVDEKRAECRRLNSLVDDLQNRDEKSTKERQERDAAEEELRREVAQVRDNMERVSEEKINLSAKIKSLLAAQKQQDHGYVDSLKKQLEQMKNERRELIGALTLTLTLTLVTLTLGLGDRMTRKTPCAVGGSIAGVRISQIACGDSHALALASTGAVYSWGNGSQGRLGTSERDACLTPAEVTRLWTSGVVAIGAGALHSVSIGYPWAPRVKGIAPLAAGRLPLIPASLGDAGSALSSARLAEPAAMKSNPWNVAAAGALPKPSKAGVLAPLEAAFKRVEAGSLSTKHNKEAPKWGKPEKSGAGRSMKTPRDTLARKAKVVPLVTMKGREPPPPPARPPSAIARPGSRLR